MCLFVFYMDFLTGNVGIRIKDETFILFYWKILAFGLKVGSFEVST